MKGTFAAFLVLAMAAIPGGCSPAAPGQGTDVVPTLVEAVTLDPLAPGFDAFLEGEQLRQARRARAAVAAFEVAVSLQPGIAEFQRRRDEAVRVAQPKEAALTKAEAQSQATLKFDYDRARALRDLGEYGPAVEAFQRVLTVLEQRADPAEAGGLGLLHQEFGGILSEAGRHAEALAAYERALALRPDLPGKFFLERGKVLLRLGETKRALGDFETLLANKPGLDAGEGLFHRAVALQRLGRTTEAREAWDAWDRYGVPYAGKALERASNLRGWGFLDEALAAFDALLGESGLAEYYIGRGRTLMDLGRHEEALADFAGAGVESSTDPSRFFARYDRGDALARLGRYAEALVAYDEAEAVRPTINFSSGK